MAVKTMRKATVKKGRPTPKTKRTASSSLLRGKSTPKAKKTASGRMDKIDKAVLLMTTSIAETNARIEKTTQNLSESTEEMRRELRKTTEDLAKSVEETTQETRRELRKTTEDLAKSVKDLSGNVGGINRSLGRIVEMVLLPGLMDKMNATHNYQFDIVSSDRIFKDNGQQYAEVDLFLENGDSVMAVEAKSRVKEGDVNKLLATLRKLRAHEAKAGLVGKTIYGAVAGIVFDENARRVAEENGLYLVDIDQDNDRIKIELRDGVAGRW